MDVYWEFEFAEIVYKTVVQAKDWNKPVDQGELLKFKSSTTFLNNPKES